MPETATLYAHITRDDDGVAWIEGANTKVAELVAEVKAYGWSPEELAYQHPHLTLAEVHSALAYYWDHRAEIETDLERRDRAVAAIERQVGEHPVVARLRAAGQA